MANLKDEVDALCQNTVRSELRQVYKRSIMKFLWWLVENQTKYGLIALSWWMLWVCCCWSWGSAFFQVGCGLPSKNYSVVLADGKNSRAVVAVLLALWSPSCFSDRTQWTMWQKWSWTFLSRVTVEDIPFPKTSQLARKRGEGGCQRRRYAPK